MSTVSSGSGKGFWRKPCLVLDLKNKQAILRRAMSVCRCGINGLGVRCGSIRWVKNTPGTGNLTVKGQWWVQMVDIRQHHLRRNVKSDPIGTAKPHSVLWNLP